MGLGYIESKCFDFIFVKILGEKKKKKSGMAVKMKISAVTVARNW